MIPLEKRIEIYWALLFLYWIPEQAQDTGLCGFCNSLYLLGYSRSELPYLSELFYQIPPDEDRCWGYWYPISISGHQKRKEALLKALELCY
jgi:hypothetical protein